MQIYTLRVNKVIISLDYLSDVRARHWMVHLLQLGLDVFSKCLYVAGRSVLRTRGKMKNTRLDAFKFVDNGP